MTCKNLIIVTILALIFFNFTSCKKFGTFEQKNTLQETKFFETISATNPIVIKVVDELKRQQGINPKMISTIVHRNGYPLWDKAQIKYRTTNASVIENAEDRSEERRVGKECA